MRKIGVIAILCLGFALSMKAQNTDLEKVAKIDIGLEGVSIGYEYPLALKWLATLQVGVGPSNHFQENSYTYAIVENGNIRMGYFVQSQARYYWGRKRRAEKGFSNKNNAGAYIGFQTKYNDNYSSYSGAWLNNIHVGQQVPVSSAFSIRYYIGVGYGYNFKDKIGGVYPALGFNFSLKLF